MPQFKIGDRVHDRGNPEFMPGTVTHLVGANYAVAWDDDSNVYEARELCPLAEHDDTQTLTPAPVAPPVPQPTTQQKERTMTQFKVGEFTGLVLWLILVGAGASVIAILVILGLQALPLEKREPVWGMLRSPDTDICYEATGVLVGNRVVIQSIAPVTPTPVPTSQGSTLGYPTDYKTVSGLNACPPNGDISARWYRAGNNGNVALGFRADVRTGEINAR